MKTIIILLLILLAVYFLVGLVLYLKQRDLLYYPSEKVTHSYPTMILENEGEKIHMTITNPGQEKALLYFGGNGEAVAAGAQVFAEELPDYTTYLVDYRGYGQSTGKPTEAGLFSDALVLYDAIHHKHQSISLFGRSLGTGIACYVASQKETEKLVLITPYDSVKNIAQARYPLYPMGLLIKDPYNSLKRVPRIKAKTLILIAEHDTVVPKQHAYRLANAFPQSQVEVHEIKGSAHNTIAQTPEYHHILGVFFHER